MKLHHFYNFIILICFLFFSTFSFSKEILDKKIRDLTLELRCMTCQNQSIHDSDSDFANDIKSLVEGKFNEGLNKKEIKIFLTKRYGEYILFKPYFNIKNLFLWIFPFTLLILSIFIFIKNLKKN